MIEIVLIVTVNPSFMLYKMMFEVLIRETHFKIVGTTPHLHGSTHFII